MKQMICDKLKRMRSGELPRFLDLFSGCGGISLGAQLAGGEIVAGLELDREAARSHALNFHAADERGLFAVHSKARDITKHDPCRFISEVVPQTKDPRMEIDVLVGGPPCQAFARVGRAKLREIMEHPDAFLHDKRSGLCNDYIRFVEALAPVAVVVENVPDVLNYGGLNIFETICGALSELGYECGYGLLNAVHYGVPQMRTRCFLVGISRLAGVLPTMPRPTHSHQLPIGYHGTRDVAIKNLSLFEESHYKATPTARGSLPPANTAHDALLDLPKITSHLNGELRKAARRFNVAIRLPDGAPPNWYTGMMRNWPAFESDGCVYDHVIRYLPRDYKIFARMKPGDQYPEAHALAMRMRDEAVAVIEAEQGRPLSTTSRRYQELTSYFVPPYDPGKFPNKWRKMEQDQPARTLMAHIGKDGYSHIHYDSLQARTISVREAARLQSFPDGFCFSGTMNPAFRQIGNAVPPLLAYAVVDNLLSSLLGRPPQRITRRKNARMNEEERCDELIAGRG